MFFSEASVTQIPVFPSLACKGRPENTPSAFDRDTKIYVFLITFHTGRCARRSGQVPTSPPIALLNSGERSVTGHSKTDPRGTQEKERMVLGFRESGRGDTTSCWS